MENFKYNDEHLNEKESLEITVNNFDAGKRLKVGDFDLGPFNYLSLNLKNKSNKNNPLDTLMWRDIYLSEKVNLFDFINNQRDLGIEIAGPTFNKEYDFFNIKINKKQKEFEYQKINLFKEYSKHNKIFISNILDGAYSILKDKNNNEKIILKGKANFMADGTQMPIKDEKFGAVFVSNIGKLTYDWLMKLKKQGVYVPQKELELAEKIKKDLEGKSSKEREIYIKEQTKNLKFLVLEESKRILKNDGILVFNGLDEDAVLYALNLGFKIIQIEYFIFYKGKQKIYMPEKAVFIKNNSNIIK